MSEQQFLSDAGYSDTAISYYLNKPYYGELPDASQVCEMTGTCGDTMKIFLKIDNNIITDVRYQVMGCAGALSSAMAVADLIKMKSTDYAETITDGDVFKKLVDMPTTKNHCIQLSVKTLHKALEEYKVKHPVCKAGHL